MKVTPVYASSIPGMTIGQSIAHIARVSNPTNQGNNDTAPRLLAYMIRHEHWSPFEMVDICFEISDVSLAVVQQILRHRSFVFQQFSQRYSAAMKIGTPEIRRQAVHNRQSSTDVLDLSDEMTMRIARHLDEAEDLYHDLLELDASRETARMLLPSCTTTRIYMKGSVRSWIHYIKLRTKPDTQKEHREVAEAVKVYFLQIIPELAFFFQE